jgi:UDP-glucose 4-epimerase
VNFFPLEAFYSIGGNMRTLVTGGAGFLGRYVLELTNGFALDNLDPRCGGDGTVAHIDCDVTDYRKLEEAILAGGFSHIAHLAAYGRNLSCRDFPSEAWRVNVHGTRNVLKIAKDHPDVVKRVVVCSSNIVLSDQFTIYKATKLAAELEVQFYGELGVSCMGLRPSNIYGVGQSRTEHQLCAFAGLDESYARNKKFTISGNGSQTRDWIHAGDVARAFFIALTSDFTTGTLDICTGRQTSMNQIANLLHVPVEYMEARPGDAQALISNAEPARQYLGFEANIVLEDAIWDAFPSIPRGGRGMIAG